MFAASSEKPALTRGVTPIVAAMMYAAVEGSPIPMTIHASIIRTSIRKVFPPESLKTILVNFTPIPVIDTIPMTIPAQAHAIATLTVVFMLFTHV